MSTVWDRDILKPDDPLGSLSIPLEAVRAANNQPVEAWYPVVLKGVQHGEVLVRLQVLPPPPPPVEPAHVDVAVGGTAAGSTGSAAGAAGLAGAGAGATPAPAASGTVQGLIQEERAALQQRGVDVGQPAAPVVASGGDAAAAARGVSCVCVSRVHPVALCPCLGLAIGLSCLSPCVSTCACACGGSFSCGGEEEGPGSQQGLLRRHVD
jgi:hypothetical protein